jgi:hypothetical protein
MFRGKKKLWLAMLTAVLLLFVAACESIGGVDINKALQNSATVKSYEGSASVSLELLFDEDLAQLMGMDPALFAVLKDFRIELEKIKMESASVTSASGYIAFSDQKIPLSLYSSATETVLQVEGIERPLVMDSGISAEDLAGLISDAELAEISQSFNRSIMEYVTVHLPNPKQISVEPTTVEINGENVFTTKVNAVLYGDELLDWLKLFLQNLAKDEEGLREFLSDAYDALFPIIVKSIEQERKALEDEDFDTEILRLMEKYADNKTLVVEFLYTTLAFGYEEALNNYDEFAEELNSSLQVGGLNLLNRDTYLDFSVYVDSALRVRKSEAELLIKPELPLPVPGFDGIRVSVTQDIWNVNGNVTADRPDVADGISVDDWEFSRLLNQSVDPDSAIADLLRLAGANTETFYVWLDEEEVFKSKGASYAEAYWLAYYLDLNVSWDMETNEVVIFNKVTGQTLEMQVDSRDAALDGEALQLSAAPVIRDAMLYLPVRAVAEAFGGVVEYDADWDMATITFSYY